MFFFVVLGSSKKVNEKSQRQMTCWIPNLSTTSNNKGEVKKTKSNFTCINQKHALKVSVFLLLFLYTSNDFSVKK